MLVSLTLLIQAGRVNRAGRCAEASALPLPRHTEVRLGAGVEFILPTDVIIADKFAEDANDKVVAVDAIPEGWMVRPCSPLSLLICLTAFVNQKTMTMSFVCVSE